MSATETLAPVAGTAEMAPAIPALPTGKKRKRQAPSEPAVRRELRTRDPKAIVKPAPTEPPKKRPKVKANAWRHTRTGRLIPFYENSDYESGDQAAKSGNTNSAEKAMGSLNGDQASNSIGASSLNTDLPTV